MSEITTEKITTPLDIDDGDHERFTHIVPVKELERAIFEGIPCTALCGKKWVPHKDLNKFPLCPRCKELWDQLEDE